MTFEPVLMIWDYYDGPRTGLAEYQGSPHYFNCPFDTDKGNYSEMFELSPVDESFLQSAQRQWKIFREWELKFHTGLAEHKTHPGYRGTDDEYDRLEDDLNSRIKKLIQLPNTFSSEFRALPNQDDLPKYVMRDLEANWRELS